MTDYIRVEKPPKTGVFYELRRIVHRDDVRTIGCHESVEGAKMLASADLKREIALRTMLRDGGTRSTADQEVGLREELYWEHRTIAGDTSAERVDIWTAKAGRGAVWHIQQRDLFA